MTILVITAAHNPLRATEFQCIQINASTADQS